MGKKKLIKGKAKKVAKKEVRKLLGVTGSKHPLLANPANREQQLMTENPYLCSLMDPFGCGSGSKIPGFGNMATATFSVWDRRNVTVNTNQIVGYFLQGLMPGLNGAPVFSAGWTLGTAAVDTNLFASYNTAAPVGFTNILLGNVNTGTTIDATYQDLRVVSAGIGINYTGTTLTDSGFFVGSSYPRESGAFSWPPTTNLAVADFRNSPYSKEVAVNKHKGLTVIYKASDAASYNFVRTGTRGYPLNQSVGAVSTMFSDGFGSMAVIGTGLTAGQSCVVISVINYEAHPEPASTSLIGTTARHNDPLALAHAENVMDRISPVTAGTQSVPDNNNYAPGRAGSTNAGLSTQGEEKKPNFLNKVLGMASQVPKYAGMAAEGLEAMAPLAALL